MRIWLVALALVACQGHRDEPAKQAPPPATDPWAGTAPDSNAPPSLADRRQREDEICPKITSPYFYRVEKAGHASYLLGTRHIGVSLSKFPEAVRDRVHDAKLVVFELDPADHYKEPREPHDLPAELGPALWTHYTELVGTSM